MGQGLLTNEGEVWSIHHKVISPSLQPSVYKHSIPKMQKQISKLISSWEHQLTENSKNSISIELAEEMSRITLDNIGIISFGSAFGAIEDHKNSVFHDVGRLLSEMQSRAQQLWPIYTLYPKFMTKTFDGCNERMHQVVREKIKGRGAVNSESKGSFIVLDALIDACNKKEISNSDIDDEMITQVMGGHETLAGLMTWIFYLLDQYPDTQQKVLQEIEEIFGDKKEIISFEQLEKMQYLEAALKETLRLYPVAPLLNRTTCQ